MLNIRSRGFDRAQYILLDMWWNMLIKFSKQTANTIAKITNGYKRELKTLSNIWDGVFTRFRGELRILAKHLRWSSLQELSKTKSFFLFLPKPLSWMFDKVLNMFLNWLPNLRKFNPEVNLNIKVRDNLLLRKSKKKESNKLQNSWMKMLLKRTHS